MKLVGTGKVGNGYGNHCEILDILKNNRIVIYGTGYVARRFYVALCTHRLEKNIECFVTSRKEENLTEIEGIAVKSLFEYVNGNRIIICIAVHETLKDEIEETLNRKGIENYIWIYPYLNELYLGKPIKENVKVSVNIIIEQCRDYRLAVRLLALENYLGKNDYGFEIYKKAQRLYCNEITAEKRLKSFGMLVERCEKHGYNQDSKILIDEKGQLLDGAHRITLAKYFRTDEVNCDIFRCSSDYFEWVGEEAVLSKSKMESSDFTEREIELMENAYQRMRGEEWEQTFNIY